MDVAVIGKNIAKARKKAGISQQVLAQQVGVSVQAVSKWENGHNLPDIENLMQIADATNSPYSFLLGVGESKVKLDQLQVRDRLFREENMFTRMKTFATANHLEQTYKALGYMRERHAGQLRKKAKFTTADVQYINHPLMMACQAIACGIKDDALLSAILLHDVVEDTGVTKEELPFTGEVQTIVGLVSFFVPAGKTKEEAKKAYYQAIEGNGKACVVKLLDRCNNVSTMAGTFRREKIIEYVTETEEYVLPLTEVIKSRYPEYADVAFLVKYHIVSVLETIKNLMLE